MKFSARTTVFLAVLASAACSPLHETRNQREGQDRNIEASVAQPDDFLYRQIEFDGAVQRVFGKCAFEVTDETSGFFDESLLVLCTTEPTAENGGFVPPTLHAGDHLHLKGDIREMTRKEYEYKTAATVPTDDFGARETRPTLWADSFEIIPKKPSGS